MESEGGWGSGHGSLDWARIADHDHGEDREVRISDLEIDLSK
jgi:hypothetical protein